MSRTMRCVVGSRPRRRLRHPMRRRFDHRGPNGATWCPRYSLGAKMAHIRREGPKRGILVGGSSPKMPRLGPFDARQSRLHMLGAEGLMPQRHAGEHDELKSAQVLETPGHAILLALAGD